MINRVLTTSFDGTQSGAVPVIRGAVSPQHFTVFNSKPVAGFLPITPRIVNHYEDSADLLVPSLWQGSVDVTLFDGIGGPWPASQSAYGQATFANSQQATVTFNKTFADAFFRVQVGAVTITDGAGPVIATPDYSTRTPSSIVVNTTSSFTGTVDLVAFAGNGKLSAMGGQRSTGLFTGAQQFVDVSWPSALGAYVATVGATDLGTGGAFFNIINRTPSGFRVQPLAAFSGGAEIAVFASPTTPRSFSASFNGTQDSIAASWADLGATPFSVLVGVTDLDGLGDVVPHLTGRSSTGATINISQRFTGTVELVVLPNQ